MARQFNHGRMRQAPPIDLPCEVGVAHRLLKRGGVDHLVAQNRARRALRQVVRTRVLQLYGGITLGGVNDRPLGLTSVAPHIRLSG